jgi:hypothetical protein
MRRLLIIGLMAFAGCLAERVEPADNRMTTMAMMPEARNAAVSLDANPFAPAPPDIGIAIAFDPSAAGKQRRFRIGDPIVLNGAYQANGALLKQCKWNLSQCASLAFARLDKPAGETASLKTLKMEVKTPNDAVDPQFSESYREGGQFRVDLTQFFPLPREPGKYAIQALLGTHKSGRLEFDIVP